MIKKLLFVLIFSIFLIACQNNLISVNDFKDSLEKYIESKNNVYGFDVEISDDEMRVIYEGEEYILNYSLDGKPIFTYEVEIEKGISYNEYLIKTEALSFQLLGFIAVSSLYGVDIEDSSSFYSDTYLKGMMDLYSYDKVYIVVDEPSNVETNAKIILTSEFGERVIEYVQSFYDKEMIVEDKENKTYIYKLTTDCSKSRCKLKSKLTINPKGNFKNISGYNDFIVK